MSSLRRIFAVGSMLLVLATSASAAGREATEQPQLPPAIARAVTHYAKVLSRISGAKRRQNLEGLSSASRQLKEALLGRIGDEAAIEQLTEAQFDEVVRRTRGVIVNREDVLVVEPDASFFLSLARTYGTKADVHFAEAYAATYPDGIWPSYVWQETDVTGCTAFGGGELVARYSAWLSFRSRHPKAYRSEARAQIGKIESHVVSDCACGSRDDVLAELERFAQKFPSAALRLGLTERIAFIRAGRSEIRFDCSPA